ncbi:hypothetical protein [Priestia koreensis]|uniref:hypothetical protein n=1 Tax=Priestia koreensis TaxID=284581 RepID=UPI0034580A6E
MIEFFKSELFGLIICIMFGFLFTWGIFKFITKDVFLNTDKFEDMKKITPLPPVFNFYLIKVILILGAIICFGGSILSFIRDFN